MRVEQDTRYGGEIMVIGRERGRERGQQADNRGEITLDVERKEVFRV